MENNSPRKLAMEYNSPPMQSPEEEKFDLSFQFHASRVPDSGWDKLMVSLISLDTGKAAGKTSKCRIRNGFCQWPDTLVETVKLARNPFSGGYADKRYKLLVQMGSLRVGILGEAIVNLSEFVRDDVPETISLPLRNCSAGTILHVKIQCLTPKCASREFEQYTSSSLEQGVFGSVSEDDDGSQTKSVESFGSQTKSSQVYSPNSQMQARRSTWRFKDRPYNSSPLETFSYGNDWTNATAVDVDDVGHWKEHGSAYIMHRSRDIQGSKWWNEPSSWECDRFGSGTQTAAVLPKRLEAAEATVQELQGERLTRDQRTRQLAVEVEGLKQQLATERTNVIGLKIELTALEIECDRLRLEVEQLKNSRSASKKWGNEEEYSRWEAEDSRCRIMKLQEEANYGKELSEDLRLQLCKTQDSNSELIHVVTELEETLEVKNKEFGRLTEANGMLQEQLQKLQALNAALISGVKGLVSQTQGIDEFHAGEGNDTIPRFDDEKPWWGQQEVLELLQEAKEELDRKNTLVFELEAKLEGLSGYGAPKFLEEKQIHIDKLELHVEDVNAPVQQLQPRTMVLYGAANDHDASLLDIDEEYQQRLLLLEKENADFKESFKQVARSKEKLEVLLDGLRKEKEELELEVQCLSEESSKILRKNDVEVFELSQSLESHMTAKKKLEAELEQCCIQIERQSQELMEKAAWETKLEGQCAEAEEKCRLLEASMDELLEERRLNKSHIEELEFQMPILSEEVKLLSFSKKEYYTLASRLEEEKSNLKEDLEEAQQESRICSEKLEELVGKVTTLSTALDSELVSRRAFERRASELEKDKKELEVQIGELEEVNVQLSERISGLEAQLRYVTEERESFKLEAETARACNLEQEAENDWLETNSQDLEKKASLGWQEVASVLVVDELKRQKGVWEDKLVRFQSLLEAQEAGKAQEAERLNELIRLKRHVSQAQRKLAEQEEEKCDLKWRVKSLEVELSEKVDALATSEIQLRALEASGKGKRSMDRSYSQLGSCSTLRDSRELFELRERSKILEMDLKAKEDELTTIKGGAMERETDLLRKPDELEWSNELPAGVNDIGTDCLKDEQENRYVEPQLGNVSEPAECHLLLEKIVNLETELTEAVEANNMYKLQLRSVFDQQHNVTMAALQDLGDVDQVWNDVSQYKKKATELERELHDMHERYSLISLQLAEAEAERGELMMALKNQKITKG